MLFGGGGGRCEEPLERTEETEADWVQASTGEGGREGGSRAQWEGPWEAFPRIPGLSRSSGLDGQGVWGPQS